MCLDILAKVRREIAHAPAQARAAEAAPLARKSHKSIPLAVVADDAQEPVRQDPALEERLDLFDHKARQLRTRFAGAHLGKERAPVRLHGLVEDGVLGAVALVGGATRRCRSGCQGGLCGGHPESSSDPPLWFRGPRRHGWGDLPSTQRLPSPIDRRSPSVSSESRTATHHENLHDQNGLGWVTHYDEVGTH